jgi:hypothetical protein
VGFKPTGVGGSLYTASVRATFWAKVVLMAMATGGAARAAPLIEAESAIEGRSRGGERDRTLMAYGGASLGNGWGGARGDWAEFEVQAPGGPVTLHLRYARERRDGPSEAKLFARLGGRGITLALPETRGWDLWRWIAVPLGDVPDGKHTLRFEAVSGGPVNVDVLIVDREGVTPPEVSRRLLFDGSRHLRVQLSPGVQPLEVDKLFAIGEATYGFLRDYLGHEPKERLTVNVVAKAESREAHVGHSVGYALYLEEARIWDTSHNWVHEMTHCFQRDTGFWPTWLSEGEAWLTYYEAETALFGRAASEVHYSPALWRQRLPELRRALIVEGRNLVQEWGGPGLPSDKVGAAYGFANHIAAELRERFGPDLLRRYRAILKREAETDAARSAKTIAARDAAVVERLGRAAGQDLRPLFKEWSFDLQP